jgi:thiol:disulfide interchange protein
MAWPIFGMFMFSAGLALPFFFLALFPGYLKRMPKSGGWLSRTKITMGFVLFAVGFKYLSNVDQMYQWELLTRERFLAIWVVLFALAGLYLLGLLRLDGDDAPVGVGRLAAGALFLVFAVSLIPGMFGGRLGEIDAYVPSPGPSSVLAGAAAGGGRPEAGQWIKDDFEGALALARESGKPLFVNFTGYSCTNCKWMKANMFTRPEVARVLDGMILVELYTDGVDDASEANQRLQLERYRTVAIPYYAIVSGDGETLAEFPGRTRDTNEFLAFLETPYNRELAQRR